MMRKLLSALLCGILATAALTSCQKQIDVSSKNSPASNHEINIDRFTDRTVPNIDLEKSDVKNFTAPQKGDKVVALKFEGYEGEVKIRFFPEYAEQGVTNFLGLAEDGYYDGVIFHRIISDFMIQGGDPDGTGRGGESLWGGKFDGGTSMDIIHAAGAVAYANSGSTATNGSQFYIVTGQVYEEEMFGEGYPEDRKEIFKTAGGTPSLDGGYTVFGQVYDGLDIIYTIQDVATDTTEGSSAKPQDRPIEDVVIEYMKVGEYNGEETRWFIADYK